MQTPVATYVYASDPISQAGVISQLRQRPEIRVVDAEHLGEAVVAVVVADVLTDEVLRVLRALQRGSVPRTVLVARVIDDSTLVAAAEVGVGGLLRRGDTTPESLARALLRVAAGEGEVPPDLLGRLLGQVGRLQRQVLSPRGPGLLRPVRSGGRGAQAGRQRPRHGGDRRPAVLQPAHREEHPA